MSAPRAQVVVIAKEPRPGLVKTRLCPPCTPEQAATLAEAALIDTIAAVERVPASRRVIALEGEPGPWFPPGFSLVEQRGETLGHRLRAVFDDCFASGAGPVVVLAMDTPQVTHEHIARALSCFDRGAERSAVLGPATDGGYWLIGLSHPDARVFDDVPMSTDATLADQRRQLRRCGYQVELAETMADVDTFDDAVAVAAQAPDTSFGAAVRATVEGHRATR